MSDDLTLLMQLRSRDRVCGKCFGALAESYWGINDCPFTQVLVDKERVQENNLFWLEMDCLILFHGAQQGEKEETLRRTAEEGCKGFWEKKACL